MSRKNHRPNLNYARNMDVDAWRERQVHKRLTEHLERQEREFVQAHGRDTDAQLIAYVRRKAAELGRMPHPLELKGGEYLQGRLGDWRKLAQTLGYMPASEKRGVLARCDLKRQVEEEFRRERRALRTEKRDRAAAE